MIFYVPKLKEVGAWIEFTGNGAANWRGLRNIAGVRKIAIHHSVTDPQHNWQKEVEYVRQIHMDGRGWGGIGYNIIVTSEEVNGYAKAVLIGDLASIRAHTPNSKASFGLDRDSGNWYIIGICMIGQLHINNPSPAQLRTVHEICKELLFNEDQRLPLLKSWDDVQPHKAFDSTACSGNWDYQRGKIISPDGIPAPTPDPIPDPTPTPDKEPIYVSVQGGDGYSNIAKRAGWSYWDDAGRVIADLKTLNPKHPSFARGNQLWASDPAFIVGYKNKPVPDPIPEPPKPDEIVYKVITAKSTIEFLDEKLARDKFAELIPLLDEAEVMVLQKVNKTKGTVENLDSYEQPVTPKPDIIIHRIDVVSGISKEITTGREDAIAEMNRMLPTLPEGSVVMLYEVNVTKGIEALVVKAEKPKTPRFNLILFILDFIKRLWKKSGNS